MRPASDQEMSAIQKASGTGQDSKSKHQKSTTTESSQVALYADLPNADGADEWVPFGRGSRAADNSDAALPVSLASLDFLENDDPASVKAGGPEPQKLPRLSYLERVMLPGAAKKGSNVVGAAVSSFTASRPVL